MPETHSTAAQPFRKPDHLADLFPVLRCQDHVQSKRQFLKNTNARRAHHLPV